jgi:hypothetical protein
MMRISENEYYQAIRHYEKCQEMLGDREPTQQQSEALNELLLVICLFEKQHSTIH